MPFRRLAAVGAALLTLAFLGGTGLVLADVIPIDGNGPGDQWRVPDNAVTPGNNTTTQNVDQVLNSWAQLYDADNAPAVAGLFTAGGSIRLYSTNTSTTPWTKAPTGYSPSPTPTGGTPNGGCTATGTTAIVNFLRGNGLTTAHRWPDTAAYRTLLMDTLIKPGNDPNHASSHSYVFAGSGVWHGGSGTEQMFVDYQRTGGAWKISEMDLLFNTAQPTYPCEN